MNLYTKKEEICVYVCTQEPGCGQLRSINLLKLTPRSIKYLTKKDGKYKVSISTSSDTHHS